MRAMTVEERVAALDISLFDHIPSETFGTDRASLLALQAAVADRQRTFRYLEIGSHLGGTLQPLMVDDRCVHVASIDPRPEWQPDDRFAEGWRYPDNSTQRMLDMLADVPGADLDKLETIEASTEDLDPAEVAPVDLCFVDAEHTYEAALRDARFCRTAVGDRGVIAFHDRAIIERAVQRFLGELEVSYAVWPMKAEIVVVAIGEPDLLDFPAVRWLLARPRKMWPLANRFGMAHMALEAIAAVRSNSTISRRAAGVVG
jgi:hypothetical protein